MLSNMWLDITLIYASGTRIMRQAVGLFIEGQTETTSSAIFVCCLSVMMGFDAINLPTN